MNSEIAQLVEIANDIQGIKSAIIFATITITIYVVFRIAHMLGYWEAGKGQLD